MTLGLEIGFWVKHQNHNAWENKMDKLDFLS